MQYVHFDPGVFVANAEGSLVLATYGRISSEFNDFKNASWLVTSYVLAMTAAQPIVRSYRR
jgi:uncharacterized membrane protein YoaK (UPF0700 family)